MKNKHILRFVCALIAAMLLLPLGIGAMAASNQAVNEARNGVVRIYTGPFMYQGAEYYSTGSGFAVGIDGQPSDIFITNYHVVADAPEKVYIVLTDENGEFVKCDILAYDEDVDYAILKAERIVTERSSLTLMDMSQVYVAEDVFALGFPGTSDYFTKGIIDSTIDDITVTSGTVSKKLTAADGVDYIQHDATIHSGNSGGPLLTEEGYVIGLNTLGFTYEDGTEIAGTNYALSVDYIIKALDKLDISYDKIDVRPEHDSAAAPAATEEDAARQEEEERARQEEEAKRQQEEAEAERKAREAEQEAENRRTVAIVIGVVLVVAIIAVVIIVLATRKKVHIIHTTAPNYSRPAAPRTAARPTAPASAAARPSAPAAPGAAAARPAPQITPSQAAAAKYSAAPVAPTTAVPGAAAAAAAQAGELTVKIRGVSGAYKGKELSSKTPIVIGRDASRCTLVFPADTAGVSSVHCEIRPLANGQAVLIDRGSSFGTVVGGVRRIPSGQEITVPAGTIISLGSEQQRFVINPAR